jgi:hypothetical protein
MRCDKLRSDGTALKATITAHYKDVIMLVDEVANSNLRDLAIMRILSYGIVCYRT